MPTLYRIVPIPRNSYKVQWKDWIFWHDVKDITVEGYDMSFYEVCEFVTEKDAEAYIDKMIENKRRREEKYMFEKMEDAIHLVKKPRIYP